MKNKGFTFVELLGVIIVLGIISLIAFPPIINQMRKMRDSVSDATLKIIFSATDQYMDNNKDDYPVIQDAKYCIKLQDIVDGGTLDSPIYDAQTGAEISLEKEILINIGESYTKTYELFDVGECGYIDASGAKEPVLSTNMIPIMRNEDNTAWIKSDVKAEWYNYDEKKWANAVLVTQASRSRYKQSFPGTEVLEEDILMYFVWVPRFRYKLFNTNMSAGTPRDIEIIFEGSKTTKSNGLVNGQWLTHPAFSNGSVQFDGIWIGKFETAYGPATTTAGAVVPDPEENQAVIKPTARVWRGISVYNAHLVASDLSNSTNKYGIGETLDPHLMKNTEWGAVAYLSYSKYGSGSSTFTNPDSSYRSGCAGNSQLQTTSDCIVYDSQAEGSSSSITGNIYGIYDMVGGSHEMVMGAQYNIGNSTIALSSSGFSSGVIDDTNMNYYIDKYTYGTSSTDYSRSKLGDATGEVRSAVSNQTWNSNYSAMPISSSPWIIRGETRGISNAGILTHRNSNGAAASNIGFRIVISETNI